MTGRVQTLRSNVAGNRPTGRLPGELYVNWPDLQFGVINSSNAAQDLLAVRLFSTLTNYNIGDHVIQAGALYKAVSAVTPGAFNPAQWTLAGGGGVSVGDTAPSNPQVGNLWWDSKGGQLYIWYNDGNTSQWVVAVNAGGSSTSGASVTIGDSPPTSPVAGALWYDSTGQQLYIWYNDGSSTQWVPVANQMGNPGVPLSGGTMTGNLVITPPAGISAQQVMGDNRIINGDMRIDQRNNGAAGSTASYTVDRWYSGQSPAGKIQWQQSTAGPPGFAYSLKMLSLSAYTPAAGDVFYLRQIIEADMVTDFAFGTPNAQPITLSFWTFSSLTGTFSGSITNDTGGRSYPFTFQILNANTWTRVVITIPGDTSGTWVMSGSGGSVYVIFDLGTGSARRGAAGAWATGNFLGVTGSISIVSTNGATFYAAGVKLEVGSIATPFNRQSLAKSLADCQRYYQIGNVQVWGYALAGSGLASDYPFPVVMRASPTITPNLTTQANCVATINPIGAFGYQACTTSVTANGSVNLAGTFTASAEL